MPWLPVPGSGGASDLDDLTDVDTTTSAPTDGQALVYDSASGLWAPSTVSSGGSGDLTLIDEEELASSATEIVMSSIPATYNDLVIVAEIRSDRGGGNNADLVLMQVGSGGTIDAGSNYRFVRTEITHAGISGGTATESTSTIQLGNCSASAADTGIFGVFDVIVSKYTDTARKRHIKSTGSVVSQGGDARTHQCGAVWENTANAIDIIRFRPNNGTNFVAGSFVTLYGRGVA